MAAGRFTGNATLDAFDRAVQNYGGQAGAGYGSASSGVTGQGIGMAPDQSGQSTANSMGTPSDERDGAGSFLSQHKRNEEGQQKEIQVKSNIKRAKQGRTILSDLVLKKPTLSRTEKLGVSGRLG
ncbi:MAG: hypothetical protein RIC36_14910 [Rhodospirillales bacterium]